MSKEGTLAQMSLIDSKDFTIPKTRNIGIIAHIDAGKKKQPKILYIFLIRLTGKTTTSERMLYYAGVTKRIGGNVLIQ